MPKEEPSSIQSLERAIAILKSFTPNRPERAVNELSRELGLHKSTVSRLLATLERGGLVARNPENGRYRLGIELISLAGHVITHMDVREVARPLLRQLADACQETVNLSVLDAGQVINLDQYVSPARTVRNIGWVGRHTPPHCTAAGKVLLAHLPPHQVDQILQAGMPRFTPRTITDPEQLQLELALVRRRGYAVAEEELEEGLNAVAAPVFRHTGWVETSICISAPAFRVPPRMFPELAARLMDIASQISQQLGYKGGV